MPSGYERSPDYGGPPASWWGIAAIVLVIVALGALKEGAEREWIGGGWDARRGSFCGRSDPLALALVAVVRMRDPGAARRLRLQGPGS
jgi:hypothetical protein